MEQREEQKKEKKSHFEPQLEEMNYFPQ